MKNGIPADKYYFLLEWKDANMDEYLSIKGGQRMCDLPPYELNKLYEAIKASESETSNESEEAAVMFPKRKTDCNCTIFYKCNSCLNMEA